jgi:hypothetical protein
MLNPARARLQCCGLCCGLSGAPGHGDGREDHKERIDGTKIIGLRVRQVIDEWETGQHNGKADGQRPVSPEYATQTQQS